MVENKQKKWIGKKSLKNILIYIMNKKIKIVLINPSSFKEERYGRELKKFGATSEPLGLAYLAANLEKHNHDVSILDSIALDLSIKETVQRVSNENPDLIGLTILTPMYSAVKKTAILLKQALPKTKIILGGAHATALPKETLLDISSVDYICIGEGENTIVNLANHLSQNKNISQVNGLAYRKQNNEIAFTDKQDFEKNLDEFPPPARHLLPMDRYQLTISRVESAGYCPTMILARGCPFNCSFCSHPFGRSFRHHSVERILGELKDLIDNYQINQVNFEADTLTANKDFLVSLCRGLIKSGLNKKIKWTCESRVDTVDKESLKAMKRAGCWEISYGVESGVKKLLNIVDKNITLKQIENIFKITKKTGIVIRGFFMLGLPSETIEESWQTINFAKKLDPLWAQFTVTIPYPGTPLFENLKNQNKIRHFDWDAYNTWGGWSGKDIPFIPENRTAQELKKLQKQAVVSFYLRPKTFFKFLRQINSFRALRAYWSGFLVLVKTKIKKI